MKMKPIRSILVIYETDSNTTGFLYIRTRDGAKCEGYIHSSENNLLHAFHLTDKGWRDDYFYTIHKIGIRKFKSMELQYCESNPERICKFVLNSVEFVGDKNLV